MIPTARQRSFIQAQPSGSVARYPRSRRAVRHPHGGRADGNGRSFYGEEMMVQSADTHPLLGTWKLISFQAQYEGSNELQPWWDEHPVGIVIFTKDGRMLAVLTAGD